LEEEEKEAKEERDSRKVTFRHMCKCADRTIQSKGLALDIKRISDTRSILICAVCKEDVATWDFQYDRKIFTR
jgi:hypothetical protein